MKIYHRYTKELLFDGANLSGAKMEISPVPQGKILGYKKVTNGIVTLEIPEESKRSKAFSSKHRCEFAKVIQCEDFNGNQVNQLTSIYNSSFVYKLGEFVYPDSFDENWWKECSNGIHFFLSKEEARNYYD